jgi:5-methylcytosine-specific restriction protein A
VGTPSSKDKRIRGHKGVALRKRRMARTNWLCEDCTAAGRLSEANVVDHIQPLGLGGEDVDSNTRNLCHECHAKRTAEQFGRKAKIKQTIGLDGWAV